MEISSSSDSVRKRVSLLQGYHKKQGNARENVCFFAPDREKSAFPSCSLYAAGAEDGFSAVEEAPASEEAAAPSEEAAEETEKSSLK